MNLTVEESKNELNELSRSHDLIQGEKQSLEQILEGVKEENARLAEIVLNKEKQYTSLQSILEEKSQLVDSLKDSLANEADKVNIIEELEQFKISNERAECELQSALNRLEELETVLKNKNDELKEKTEKASKLRNVALKAKKELENIRSKGQEEKCILEDQIKGLVEEAKLMKNELIQQKTECSKHEEEFEVFFLVLSCV